MTEQANGQTPGWVRLLTDTNLARCIDNTLSDLDTADRYDYREHVVAELREKYDTLIAERLRRATSLVEANRA